MLEHLKLLLQTRFLVAEEERALRRGSRVFRHFPGAAGLAPSIASARYWARSCTWSCASAPLAEMPSRNIVRQKGHAVATRGAWVRRVCSTRLWLMRVPIFSSIHMRPPPAPQQKPRL